MISFIAVEGTPLPKGRRKLRRWLQRIAEDYGVRSLDLSYAFGSSEWMAELNQKHLGHKGDTDILTFDYGAPQATRGLSRGGPYRRTIIHGECCISPHRVKLQSVRWSNSDQEEMRRVLVHGLLHLIGFDDKKSEDQKLMREAEDRALVIFDSL